MVTRELARLLFNARFRFSNEGELQRGIATLLSDNNVGFLREVILTPQDRIDFMVGKIGIEVKVDGALAAVTRQLFRYASLPEIEELILVTTRSKHCALPESINNKPVTCVYLLNSFL